MLPPCSSSLVSSSHSYDETYSIVGLEVLHDGTVTFCRENKLKVGFGVVHCCYYDGKYLQLMDMGGLNTSKYL